MKELDDLEEALARAGHHLPDDDRKRIGDALLRTRDAFALLETKYLDAIRDRAIVHSLLKRTSEDLIQRYRAIFEYSGTAMVVLEQDGIISLANSYFATMAGHSRSEIEGFRKFSEFADNGLNDFIAGFPPAGGDGSPALPHYGEGQITDRNGKRSSVVVRVGRFPDTGQCVLSILDITDLKRAEEELRQANRKLNLLSGITRHDIKNQLMVLLSYLEISKNSLEDLARTAEFIEKEKRIAGVIAAQISFTKEYEDLGVRAPAWQDVDAAIKRMISGLSLRDVSIEIRDLNLEVFADPLLEKVFYNLIDNALRYGGSTMTTIRCYSRKSEGGLLIVVEDDGDGISAEDKGRLFERGFGKNTGLGLFLSHEILSIKGMSIAETSEPGKGARFEIAVPEGQYRFIEDR